MYLPVSFPKREYSEMEARATFNLYLNKNEDVLKAFGLCFYGHTVTESHTDTDYVFALDNSKFALGFQQRHLYLRFLEESSRRYTELHNTVKEYVPLEDHQKLLDLFLSANPSQQLIDQLPVAATYKVKVNND